MDKKEVSVKSPENIREIIEKEKLLQPSEISLWLDSYNDIFSSFDPRSFSERALSDDFLVEAKKASLDKSPGRIELNFLVPKEKRKLHDELMIKKRLREHFKKHHDILKNDVRKILKFGISFILLGIVSMFIASYILFKFPVRNFFTHFLIVLLEPAGWFMFWEGLDYSIFESKQKSPDLLFYEKMSNVNIMFTGY